MNELDYENPNFFEQDVSGLGMKEIIEDQGVLKEKLNDMMNETTHLANCVVIPIWKEEIERSNIARMSEDENLELILWGNEQMPSWVHALLFSRLTFLLTKLHAATEKMLQKASEYIDKITTEE